MTTTSSTLSTLLAPGIRKVFADHYAQTETPPVADPNELADWSWLGPDENGYITPGRHNPNVVPSRKSWATKRGVWGT